MAKWKFCKFKQVSSICWDFFNLKTHHNHKIVRNLIWRCQDRMWTWDLSGCVKFLSHFYKPSGFTLWNGKFGSASLWIAPLANTPGSTTGCLSTTSTGILRELKRFSALSDEFFSCEITSVNFGKLLRGTKNLWSRQPNLSDSLEVVSNKVNAWYVTNFVVNSNPPQSHSLSDSS